MIQIKALAIAAVVATPIIFGAGWVTKGKFEDSKDLAAMQAQKLLADQVRKDFATHSRSVEQQLGKLSANERVIDRGIIREIEKPVFVNVCIPPDGDAFRLLELLAKGAAPGESDDQVPAGTPDAD